MAASNSTEYLGLNQWAENDYVLRTDFNSDNLKIDNALATAVHIVSGTYTGTGTNGPENVNTLTFDFAPKLVIITSDADSKLGIGCSILPWKGKFMPVLTRTSNTSDYQVNGLISSRVTWSADGKTVTWYNNITGSAAGQMNLADTTYSYVAIA